MLHTRLATAHVDLGSDLVIEMEFHLPSQHNSALVKASNKGMNQPDSILLIEWVVSNILLNCLTYTTSENLDDRYTQGHKDY